MFRMKKLICRTTKCPAKYITPFGSPAGIDVFERNIEATIPINKTKAEVSRWYKVGSAEDLGFGSV
jgi:hypothetical protein